MEIRERERDGMELTAEERGLFVAYLRDLADHVESSKEVGEVHMTVDYSSVEMWKEGKFRRVHTGHQEVSLNFQLVDQVKSVQEQLK